MSGPTVFDEGRTTPLLLIREAALRHNLAAMRQYCAANDVALAPHVKTHMSPELFALQREHGAIGATVANVAQLAALAAFGAREFLIANEVLDPGDLATLTALRRSDPDLVVAAFVDSVAGVHRMTEVLGPLAGGLDPLPVLVEFGPAGLRAGCRTSAEVLAVADAVADSPALRLTGLAGYEGLFAPLEPDARAVAVRDYLDAAIHALRALLDRGDLDDGAIATFGGSTLFSAVVDQVRAAFPPDRVRVVLRSGCYLVHDHGEYAQAQREVVSRIPAPRFLPALEVWAPVLSAPEPGFAVAGLGRRDVSFDDAMPIPLAVRRDGRIAQLDGATVTRLYDQHAVLEDPHGRLLVGDLVGVGISHPCSTFDRWRTGAIVDDEYHARGAFQTAFP